MQPVEKGGGGEEGREVSPFITMGSKPTDLLKS